jgi:dienelactone hydrolase
MSLVSRTTVARDGCVVESLQLRLPDGEDVRGFLTRPERAGEPLPAILLAHAHGGRYDIGADELTDGRPAWVDPPGPALARAGFVALSVDMPTFGSRAGVTEGAAAKAALWYGRTLFGQMLGEQAGALTWLAGREDVDPARIGAMGISMGATLAYFLAALDARVAVVAQLCCYADFATLVETGTHDRHGHYLTVPGLLRDTSTGAIAGMVAPRPQLICVGLDDPLTPPAAVERAFAETSAAYAAAGAPEAVRLFAEAGVGHRETAGMRGEMVGFLRGHLGVDG